MENNSDKILRDKLAGLQPPFEPQAWQQMEAMLNKNEKPKGFLFWWLGGIAFLLATGILLYSVSTMNKEQLSVNNELPIAIGTSISNDHPDSYRETINNQQLDSDKTSENIQHSTDNNNQPKTINNEQLPINNEKTTDDRQQNQNNKQQTTTDNNNQPKTKNQKLKTPNDKPETTNNQQSTSNSSTAAQKSNTQVSKSKKGSTDNSSAIVSENNMVAQPDAVAKNETPNSADGNNVELIALANDNPNSVAADEPTPDNSSTAAITENQIAADTPTEIAEATPATADSFSNKNEEKQTEEAVEKALNSATKFHYSLGVASTLTATVTKGTLGPDPSYSVGFVNEFLFVNRVALSMGFNYSKTSYMMYDAQTELSTVMPLELKANITELTLPLSVKVYPVSNQKFRYYVNTGIINHIKLQENFVYMLPATDTTSNPNLPQTANDPAFNYVPQTTNFGSTAAEALFDSNNLSGGSSSPSISNSDFSLNNAQRYYMSFFAATGVEFIIKKRLVIFAETLYFTNLHPLGVQDTRKHNFGMGSGIRVQF